MSVHRKAREDFDIAELTDEQLESMRPSEEVIPEIVAAYRRGELSDFKKNPPRIIREGSESSSKPKTSVRVDDDVVEHFKGMGAGWQTAINQALREAINKEKV